MHVNGVKKKKNKTKKTTDVNGLRPAHSLDLIPPRIEYKPNMVF